MKRGRVMKRGLMMIVVGALALIASNGAAQLHGRFRVSFQTTVRETRMALVGVASHVESGLARCAAHTGGQPSTTRLVLRFTAAGSLRTLSSGPLEGEPAPTDDLRTCVESGVHHATLPAIHDAELIVLVRFEPPAHAPEIHVGEPVTIQEYSQESVRRVVHDHTSDVSQCYEATRASHHDTTGTITMRFSIGPDGHVTAANAATDEPGIPALTSCLAAALRTWVFPAPDGGASIEVSYPFAFHAPD